LIGIFFIEQVTGAVPIAVRHIQSIIRIAQAHAKVCLLLRVTSSQA
jgi:DNA replicative helicase MCM subunit Mcm2 (Cdc46/Mcm family)